MEAEGLFFNTSDYELRPKKLGKGAYGKVYVAKNIHNSQEYAAKIINVDKGFDGHDQMLFLRESLTLHKLSHPSIVKLIGINFKSFSNPTLLQPAIITEYLRHGSLKDNLNKERRSLSDFEWTPTKKYINLVGISDALRYLHSQGVLHRDLKPENILIDDDYHPRVCDFGLSKCLSKSLTNSVKLTVTGQFGTPLYLPPEILRGEEHYDKSVDVYAFGMIAYEIVTGNEPFSELGEISPFALINQICNGYRPQFNEFVTDKMRELLLRCWSDKPSERPSFDEIYDKLSTDRGFIYESVDESEVEDYLEFLGETRNERPGDRNELEDEVSELKRKLSEYKNEHDVLASTNNSLCAALNSLLGSNKDRNINKAVFHLEKSSKEGNRYSSFILGILNETGIEIERNIGKSFEYYERSAKQGNPKGFNRIGVCYHSGMGVEKDYKKAKECYEKAAELGEITSLANLGLLYKCGQGVNVDYNKSIEYFTKAAELGNQNALFSLGFAYENGQGVSQNYSKAIEYYRMASELGQPQALYSLGLVYEFGKGVAINRSKAIEFYTQASKFGYKDADEKLKNLK